MRPSACRLVCVTDRRFWRRSIGSEQRIASLLAHLARRGHPIVVAYPGRIASSERRAIEAFTRDLPGLEVRGRAPGWRDLVGALAPRRAGADGESNPLLQPAVPARRRFVDRLLQQIAPRVVIVEMTRLTPLVHPRMRPPSDAITYLLDAHDLLARRARRTRAAGARPALDVTEAEEIAAFATYDAILAIQSAEADAIRERVARPVLVVPHGLDLPPALPGRDRQDGSIRFGFLGGRDAANEDALHWLLDRVWPELRSRVGERAELHVAGRLCETWTRAEPGVRVIGPIASVEAFWPTIDVAVNPIRFGSGLKIKNVEALAWGRALVTSSIGAEGLEAAVPDGLLVAETAAQWLEALASLIAEPERIESLGRSGRRHAERHFSETAAFAELDAHLDALPAEPQKPR